MTSFGDFATALKARDTIRELVKDVINKERPKYKYGEVTSLSPDTNSATVRLNGEESSVPVAMGAVQPTEVGQTVRVNGLPGDRYIEDVYGSVDIPEQEGGGDADSVSGIPIGDNVAPPTGLLLTTDSYYEDIWIDASWTAPNTNDISGYDVEIAENESGTFVLKNTYRVGITSIRISGLKPATQYGVRVATINRIGVRSIYLPSSGFQVVITTQDDTIPDQVTNLTIGSGFKSLTCRWDEVDDLDVIRGRGLYEVHLDTSNAFGVTKKVQYTSGNIVSFNDLSPGVTYYVRVRAIDSSGNFGAWSTTASTTTAFVGTVDLTDALITTDKLANNAVDNSKLAALAVEAANLANSSVTSTKIANLAVGSAAIANLAVGTAHIADAAIINAKIGDLAVTSAKINNLAVTNAKIADAAIDNAKIANLDASKITAGTISADRIAANSLDVEKLRSSTLTTVQLTIGSGGSIIVGSPPTTGLLLNNQGLRLYQGSVAKVILDNTGNATFEGNINASTITGGTITGATVRTAVSGQRVAFEAGIISKLKMYTGDGQETVPGELNVGAGGPVLEVGLYAPKVSSNNFGGVQAGVTNTVGGVGYVQLQTFDNNGNPKGLLRLSSSVTAGRLAALSFIDEFAVLPMSSAMHFRQFSTVTGYIRIASPNGSAASLAVYDGAGGRIIVGNHEASASADIEAADFIPSSTERGKTNISNAPALHQKLDLLRPIQFQREDNPRTYLGFSAEEMFKHLPEAVVLNVDGQPAGISLTTLLAIVIQKLQVLTAETRNR